MISYFITIVPLISANIFFNWNRIILLINLLEIIFNFQIMDLDFSASSSRLQRDAEKRRKIALEKKAK